MKELEFETTIKCLSIVSDPNKHTGENFRHLHCTLVYAEYTVPFYLMKKAYSKQNTRPPSIFKVNLFMILCFLYKNFTLFHDFSLKFMLFSCLCRWNWSNAIAYSSWGSGGAVSPPAGPGKSPGGGPGGKAPRGSWGLAALQQQKQPEISL